LPFINELIRNDNELLSIKKVIKEDNRFLEKTGLFNVLKRHVIKSKNVSFTSRNKATFAAYPSLEKPTILCQLDKIQSIDYANRFLLPKPTGLSGLIKSTLSAIAGISYEFDEFIIIDTSYYEELLNSEAVKSVISGNPSFIELCTSHPTLLIFDENNLKPPVVFRNLPLTRHKQIERCRQLCVLNSNLFPQPVLIEEKNASITFIEQLAVGTPWFQLQHTLNSAQIRELSIEALSQFERTVQKTPSWSEEINLYDAGIRLAEEVLPSVTLSAIQRKVILEQCEKMKTYEGINVQFQHGDFSINNLIFTHDGCRIIDLEDFGELNLPLFDYISLAISFSDNFSNDISAENVLNELNFILQRVRTTQSDLYIKHCFLLFILSRFGKWSDNPNRKQFSHKLEIILTELLKLISIQIV
jgi:hypothetical protein